MSNRPDSKNIVVIAPLTDLSSSTSSLIILMERFSFSDMNSIPSPFSGFLRVA